MPISEEEMCKGSNGIDATPRGRRLPTEERSLRRGDCLPVAPQRTVFSLKRGRTERECWSSALKTVSGRRSSAKGTMWSPRRIDHSKSGEASVGELTLLLVGRGICLKEGELGKRMLRGKEKLSFLSKRKPGPSGYQEFTLSIRDALSFVEKIDPKRMGWEIGQRTLRCRSVRRAHRFFTPEPEQNVAQNSLWRKGMKS